MISIAPKKKTNIISAMIMAAAMVVIVGSWNLFWATASFEQFAANWPAMFLRSWIIAAPAIYFLRPAVSSISESLITSKHHIAEHR